MTIVQSSDHLLDYPWLHCRQAGLRTAFRCRQFGLRTVLIAVAICALTFAVFGGRIRRNLQHEHALAEIAKRGGTVLIHDEGAYVFFQEGGGPWWGGEHRAVRASLDYDLKLWTYNPRPDFTDADVPLLLGLLKPYELDLRGTQVTDAGVARLTRRWPELRIAYGDQQLVNWTNNPHEPWVCGTFEEQMLPESSHLQQDVSEGEHP